MRAVDVGEEQEASFLQLKWVQTAQKGYGYSAQNWVARRRTEPARTYPMSSLSLAKITRFSRPHALRAAELVRPLGIKHVTLISDYAAVEAAARRQLP